MKSPFAIKPIMKSMEPDDFNRVIRAITHAILKCQDDWNGIHTSLLRPPRGGSEDDANPYVLAAGTKSGELKDNLEYRAAEGAPRSQWFHDI